MNRSATAALKPFFTLLCVVWTCLLAAPPLAAEVQVRISFKVILGPNGEFPDNPDDLNLNSEQVIRDNITFLNALLTRRGESFRILLRDNTVYTVAGQSDPWFTLPARDSINAATLQITATASISSRAIWNWHDDSINVYLNDTGSGICSRDVGQIIFIGAGAYDTLLIHEIGHFLSLRHTHPGDTKDGKLDDWGDGDFLSETLDDERDADPADINARYDGDPQPFQPQEVRDDLIFNIMSYHHPPQDRFVWQQRQKIIETYNGYRDPQAIGSGRFVKSDGSDDFRDGKSFGSRLKTLEKAVEFSVNSNDVMLLDGEQNVANGTVFSKPMTWLKWRNNALIK